MPEVADAGEDHGDAVLVGGRDHLVVAHRTARLDHRLRARLDGRQQTVGKGKEGVRRHDAPFGQRLGETECLGRVLRLARGDARRIDPAHLTRADADRRAVSDIDDGVGLDVLGNAEGEFHVGEFRLARLALGHAFQVEIVDHGVVALLLQEAAGNGFDQNAPCARIGERARRQQPQILLRRDDRRRLVGDRRRNDHLGEDLDDLLRRFGVERAVQRDDAAEGRGLVAGKRLAIGVRQRLAGRHAARIGVLDDGDSRLRRIELADEFVRSVGIVDVVVG